MKNNYHSNNFNLIRLFAASQVFLHHLYIIAGADFGKIINSVSKFLTLFPGVPIFFFISGYLVSQSFERSTSLRSYYVKRILRIYPALIVSVFIGIGIIIASGYSGNQPASLNDYLILFFSKITIFQFYNPEFLRSYGSGVFNGSLWTITVELQFYILVPILYALQKKIEIHRLSFWLLIIIIFLLCNVLYVHYYDACKNNMLYKLCGVSFFPWFYMFLIGVIFQQYKQYILVTIERYAVFIVLFYILLAGYGLYIKFFSFGNFLSPLLVPFLFLSVMSVAYKAPFLSDKLLMGFDISYGVYLYHLLVVNYFLYRYKNDASSYSLLIALVVFILSALSWIYAEKPSISLKKRFDC